MSNNESITVTRVITMAISVWPVVHTRQTYTVTDLNLITVIKLKVLTSLKLI